jgi:hypothetical protein
MPNKNICLDKKDIDFAQYTPSCQTCSGFINKPHIHIILKTGVKLDFYEGDEGYDVLLEYLGFGNQPARYDQRRYDQIRYDREDKKLKIENGDYYTEKH